MLFRHFGTRSVNKTSATTPFQLRTVVVRCSSRSERSPVSPKPVMGTDGERHTTAPAFPYIRSCRCHPRSRRSRRSTSYKDGIDSLPPSWSASLGSTRALPAPALLSLTTIFLQTELAAMESNTATNPEEETSSSSPSWKALRTRRSAALDFSVADRCVWPALAARFASAEVPVRAWPSSFDADSLHGPAVARHTVSLSSSSLSSPVVSSSAVEGADSEWLGFLAGYIPPPLLREVLTDRGTVGGMEGPVANDAVKKHFTSNTSARSSTLLPQAVTSPTEAARAPALPPTASPTLGQVQPHRDGPPAPLRTLPSPPPVRPVSSSGSASPQHSSRLAQQQLWQRSLRELSDLPPAQWVSHLNTHMLPLPILTEEWTHTPVRWLKRWHDVLFSLTRNVFFNLSRGDGEGGDGALHERIRHDDLSEGKHCTITPKDARLLQCDHALREVLTLFYEGVEGLSSPHGVVSATPDNTLKTPSARHLHFASQFSPVISELHHTDGSKHGALLLWSTRLPVLVWRRVLQCYREYGGIGLALSTSLFEWCVCKEERQAGWLREVAQSIVKSREKSRRRASEAGRTSRHSSHTFTPSSETAAESIVWFATLDSHLSSMASGSPSEASSMMLTTSTRRYTRSSTPKSRLPPSGEKSTVVVEVYCATALLLEPDNWEYYLSAAGKKGYRAVRDVEPTAASSSRPCTPPSTEQEVANLSPHPARTGRQDRFLDPSLNASWKDTLAHAAFALARLLPLYHSPVYSFLSAQQLARQRKHWTGKGNALVEAGKPFQRCSSEEAEKDEEHYEWPESSAPSVVAPHFTRVFTILSNIATNLESDGREGLRVLELTRVLQHSFHALGRRLTHSQGLLQELYEKKTSTETGGAQQTLLEADRLERYTPFTSYGFTVSLDAAPAIPSVSEVQDNGGTSQATVVTTVGFSPDVWNRLRDHAWRQLQRQCWTSMTNKLLRFSLRCADAWVDVVACLPFMEALRLEQQQEQPQHETNIPWNHMRLHHFFSNLSLHPPLSLSSFSSSSTHTSSPHCTASVRSSLASLPNASGATNTVASRSLSYYSSVAEYWGVQLSRLLRGPTEEALLYICGGGGPGDGGGGGEGVARPALDGTPPSPNAVLEGEFPAPTPSEIFLESSRYALLSLLPRAEKVLERYEAALYDPSLHRTVTTTTLEVLAHARLALGRWGSLAAQPLGLCPTTVHLKPLWHFAEGDQPEQSTTASGEEKQQPASNESAEWTCGCGYAHNSLHTLTCTFCVLTTLKPYTWTCSSCGANRRGVSKSDSSLGSHTSGGHDSSSGDAPSPSPHLEHTSPIEVSSATVSEAFLNEPEGPTVEVDGPPSTEAQTPYCLQCGALHPALEVALQRSSSPSPTPISAALSSAFRFFGKGSTVEKKDGEPDLPSTHHAAHYGLYHKTWGFYPRTAPRYRKGHASCNSWSIVLQSGAASHHSESRKQACSPERLPVTMSVHWHPLNSPMRSLPTASGKKGLLQSLQEHQEALQREAEAEVEVFETEVEAIEAALEELDHPLSHDPKDVRKATSPSPFTSSSLRQDAAGKAVLRDPLQPEEHQNSQEEEGVHHRNACLYSPTSRAARGPHVHRIWVSTGVPVTAGQPSSLTGDNTPEDREGEAVASGGGDSSVWFSCYDCGVLATTRDLFGGRDSPAQTTAPMENALFLYYCAACDNFSFSASSFTARAPQHLATTHNESALSSSWNADDDKDRCCCVHCGHAVSSSSGVCSIYGGKSFVQPYFTWRCGCEAVNSPLHRHCWRCTARASLQKRLRQLQQHEDNGIEGLWHQLEELEEEANKQETIQSTPQEVITAVHDTQDGCLTPERSTPSLPQQERLCKAPPHPPATAAEGGAGWYTCTTCLTTLSVRPSTACFSSSDSVSAPAHTCGECGAMHPRLMEALAECRLWICPACHQYVEGSRGLSSLLGSEKTSGSETESCPCCGRTAWWRTSSPTTSSPPLLPLQEALPSHGQLPTAVAPTCRETSERESGTKTLCRRANPLVISVPDRPWCCAGCGEWVPVRELKANSPPPHSYFSVKGGFPPCVRQPVRHRKKSPAVQAESATDANSEERDSDDSKDEDGFQEQCPYCSTPRVYPSLFPFQFARNCNAYFPVHPFSSPRRNHTATPDGWNAVHLLRPPSGREVLPSLSVEEGRIRVHDPEIHPPRQNNEGIPQNSDLLDGVDTSSCSSSSSSVLRWARLGEPWTCRACGERNHQSSREVIWWNGYACCSHCQALGPLWWSDPSSFSSPDVLDTSPFASRSRLFQLWECTRCTTFLSRITMHSWTHGVPSPAASPPPPRRRAVFNPSWCRFCQTPGCGEERPYCSSVSSLPAAFRDPALAPAAAPSADGGTSSSFVDSTLPRRLPYAAWEAEKRCSNEREGETGTETGGRPYLFRQDSSFRETEDGTVWVTSLSCGDPTALENPSRSSAGLTLWSRDANSCSMEKAGERRRGRCDVQSSSQPSQGSVSSTSSSASARLSAVEALLRRAAAQRVQSHAVTTTTTPVGYLWKKESSSVRGERDSISVPSPFPGCALPHDATLTLTSLNHTDHDGGEGHPSTTEKMRVSVSRDLERPERQTNGMTVHSDILPPEEEAEGGKRKQRQKDPSSATDSALESPFSAALEALPLMWTL